MARFLQSLAVLAITSCTIVSSAPTQAQDTTAVPGSHQSGGEEHIVIVNKNAPIPPKVAEILHRLDLHESHPDVRHVFNNSAFQGFAASMKTHCLDLLANMTDVSTVEKAVTISRGSIPTSYGKRLNSPWGLQRISTASMLSGSESAMDYTYTYNRDTTLGAGADIYVLDTGLYSTHNVFGNRAEMLWSFDNDMSDKDGHGTHVSGTAAGAILGVASNAKIYGIKTLGSDGSGWSSNVVAGIDFVVQQHDAKLASEDANFLGSIISMSLASSKPVPAINTAVQAAIQAGIHTVVAAGNNNEDACKSSPASAGGVHGSAITVGAVDITAARASFSNYGSCVDIYAPGVDVISSWIGAPNMINSLSGTSMSAPHVTGIVAGAMGANQTLARNPALMKEWIIMNGLRLGDGSLLANNGVHDSGNEAKLVPRGVSWEFSQVKVGVAGVHV